MIILKVNFLCINSTRTSLLIHSFSPVNTQLLTVYGIAFYAIMSEYILLCVHTKFRHNNVIQGTTVLKVVIWGSKSLLLPFYGCKFCFVYRLLLTMTVDCY